MQRSEEDAEPEEEGTKDVVMVPCNYAEICFTVAAEDQCGKENATVLLDKDCWKIPNGQRRKSNFVQYLSAANSGYVRVVGLQ
ncbi:hypothetical protein VNO80_16123 [Phaseolus coccineus]|uniref:Uncharacterized protein n=1 Tax=Phaseolus coccineus TaxID=3886 RepID=A0AAN9MQ89_PHACN